MASKKKVYKNYKDYLKSEEWQKLRKLNHSRVKREYDTEELVCECCDTVESDIEMHVHHFIYPKDWNDDKMEYHIVLCKDCHDKIHDEKNEHFDKEFLVSKNRKQFLRNLNNCFRSEANEDLCSQHDSKRCYELIIIEALKKGSIKFESVFNKSDYNNKYSWTNHIEGVHLFPWLEGKLMEQLTKEE